MANSALLDKSLNAVRRQAAPITFGRGSSGRRATSVTDAATEAKSAEVVPLTTSQDLGSGGNWKHDMFSDTDRKVSTVTSSQSVGPTSAMLNIENLHYEVSERELEVLFAQIGKIAQGPVIKFDRSGRGSEGLAFVAYETAGHAEQAFEAFNGANAKGQPITLSYCTRMPTWVRIALGMPKRGAQGLELLGRIQGATRDERRAAASPYPGWRGGRSGGAQGAARGGGVVRGGAREREPVKQDVSALDKELEAFMRTPAPSTDRRRVGGGDGDVVMG